MKLNMDGVRVHLDQKSRCIVEIVLPLDKMTIADKFKIMEAIWASLKQASADVPIPAWHTDVLKARQMRVKEGSATYGDWADAKRRIHERTR